MEGVGGGEIWKKSLLIKVVNSTVLGPVCKLQRMAAQAHF